MSLPTDQQLLTLFTDGLKNTFASTTGTDDERWRAVANAALELLSAGNGFTLAKRRRKWGQPVTTPPNPTQLPPSTPIASNPDEMGIALAPVE